jgi:predicted DsbA family dithiol-disulfide isomerase
VLGAERGIIANEVAAGQVKLIFWPMLDLGPNSENAAVTAFCAGEQDPAHFWAAHDTLFENQRSVYLAGRDFFVETAAALGLDGPTFEACYDGEAMRDHIRQLDQARRDKGIRQRPTFDVNGQLLLGAQPYETFAEVILDQLP